MSGGSSSAVEWFTLLERARVAVDVHRPDDPRLGEIIERWSRDLTALTPRRAVIVGFPQDEGVRRNHGRTGAAEAPDQIRHWLYRLTPWSGELGVDLADHPPLDIGNLRIRGSLEESQSDLGRVVAAVLQTGAVPIVLGGGHETAYGHYLGYVGANRPVGILNLDAHLDVRPLVDGKAHSGSPFRQAFEHVTHPLAAGRYTCFGAQPHHVSRRHTEYVRDRRGSIYWCEQIRPEPMGVFKGAIGKLASDGCQVYVSLDADVIRAADVPGVSAPNPDGLAGSDVFRLVRMAGQLPQVASFDVVEVNPALDRDHQSARWAALAVWQFLIGLASRPG
jgi:formiminoglutamase